MNSARCLTLREHKWRARLATWCDQMSKSKTNYITFFFFFDRLEEPEKIQSLYLSGNLQILWMFMCIIWEELVARVYVTFEKKTVHLVADFWLLKFLGDSCNTLLSIIVYFDLKLKTIKTLALQRKRGKGGKLIAL